MKKGLNCKIAKFWIQTRNSEVWSICILAFTIFVGVIAALILGKVYREDFLKGRISKRSMSNATITENTELWIGDKSLRQYVSPTYLCHNQNNDIEWKIKLKTELKIRRKIRILYFWFRLNNFQCFFLKIGRIFVDFFSKLNLAFNQTHKKHTTRIKSIIMKEFYCSCRQIEFISHSIWSSSDSSSFCRILKLIFTDSSLMGI